MGDISTIIAFNRKRMIPEEFLTTLHMPELLHSDQSFPDSIGGNLPSRNSGHEVPDYLSLED